MVTIIKLGFFLFSANWTNSHGAVGKYSCVLERIFIVLHKFFNEF